MTVIGGRWLTQFIFLVCTRVSSYNFHPRPCVMPTCTSWPRSRTRAMPRPAMAERTSHPSPPLAGRPASQSQSQNPLPLPPSHIMINPFVLAGANALAKVGDGSASPSCMSHVRGGARPDGCCSDGWDGVQWGGGGGWGNRQIAPILMADCDYIDCKLILA